MRLLPTGMWSVVLLEPVEMVVQYGVYRGGSVYSMTESPQLAWGFRQVCEPIWHGDTKW